MSRRDHYEVLGVPKDAGDDDIKRAFRRKARELHPDVNPDDPEAEGKFKEAAEAYEVLSDPESRQMYDRFGHDGVRQAGRGSDFADFGSFQDLFDAFFGGDPFGSRGSNRRGDDLGVAVEISFEESATGVEREIEFEAIAPCDTCEGSGAAPGAGLDRCPSCGGQGQVREVARGPFGQFLRTQACSHCRGAGEIPAERCAACAGAGRQVRSRLAKVEIPAGISTGQQIRLTGKGHAGERGSAAGDIYVQVEVADDPRFHRQDLDVLTTVSVPVTDAMVGTEVSVPILGGETTVEVKAGTQHGEQIVLKGKGFPSLRGRGRGDQRVLVEVRIPRVEDEAGRKAVADLGGHLTDKSYREDEGLFERLKHAFR